MKSMKTTEIKVWCPICQGKEKHVEGIIIVNGKVTFELECGHEVIEKFPI